MLANNDLQIPFVSEKIYRLYKKLLQKSKRTRQQTSHSTQKSSKHTEKYKEIMDIRSHPTNR